MLLILVEWSAWWNSIPLVEWFAWWDSIPCRGMVVMTGWYTMDGNGYHGRMVLHGGEWLSWQDGITWRGMVIMTGWY